MLSHKTLRLAVFTGKRGGSGSLQLTVKRLRDRGHAVTVFVSDQHVRTEFGWTQSEVEMALGPTIPIAFPAAIDTELERVEALSTMMYEFAGHMVGFDGLVVLGDRSETLVVATVAFLMRVPIIHIQGGDVTGAQDDQMRWAITALASIHLCCNQDAKARLLSRGAEHKRVVNVGDPHLDLIKHRTPWDEVEERYLVTQQGYTIFLLHPDTLHPEDIRTDIESAWHFAESFEQDKIIAIYPCSDPGYQQIIDSIEARRDNPRVSIYKNIPQCDFHTLLKHATALIGNSSSGVIEAPYLGTKFIEIGLRQDGRYRGDYGSGFAYERICSAIEGLISARTQVR